MPHSETPGHRIHAQVHMPFDYLLRKFPESEELIILMHGYSQSGSIISSLLDPALPASVNVLAPNALFPLPKRREGKRPLYGFSWYMYDFVSQEYTMDMRYSIEFMKSGLQELGLSSMKKTLIGFSQGGYFAPLLAEELENVQQIIGIGCEFLHEELHKKPTYPMSLIQGELDEVVKLEEAQASVDSLVRQGASAKIQVLAGVGHEINDIVRARVSELLGSAKNTQDPL